MPIKAIETRYAGCRFRSRLEARWAVFFDHLKIEWQYEPQGFELPSGRYLPDFYLPNHRIPHTQKIGSWLEIKGRRMNPHEIDLAHELQAEADEPVFWLGGDVPQVHTCGCAPGQSLMATQAYVLDGYRIGNAGCLFHAVSIDAALTAARSARFEYGERGVA